jgi:hypothetical protein
MFTPIPNFNNYEITQLGEVRSVSRSVVRRDGKTMDYPSQIIKPYLKRGKPYIQLYKDGVKKCVSVSKLIKDTYQEIISE